MSNFKVRIGKGARQDLIQIRDDLTRHSDKSSADRVIAALRAEAKSLEHFPLRKPVVPELATLGINAYHQAIAAHYRIIFSVHDDGVRILLIVHQKRDLEPLLQDYVLSRS